MITELWFNGMPQKKSDLIADAMLNANIKANICLRYVSYAIINTKVHWLNLILAAIHTVVNLMPDLENFH